MKRFSLVQAIVVIFAVVFLLFAGLDVYGQQNHISYEQWSKIAVTTVKKEYPTGQLTDYKYIGRTEITSVESKDVFNIIVEEQNKSFAVKAEVFFNPKDGKLITVKLEKILS